MAAIATPPARTNPTTLTFMPNFGVRTVEGAICPIRRDVLTQHFTGHDFTSDETRSLLVRALQTESATRAAEGTAGEINHSAHLYGDCIDASALASFIASINDGDLITFDAFETKNVVILNIAFQKGSQTEYCSGLLLVDTTGDPTATKLLLLDMGNTYANEKSIKKGLGVPVTAVKLNIVQRSEDIERDTALATMRVNSRTFERYAEVKDAIVKLAAVDEPYTSVEKWRKGKKGARGTKHTVEQAAEEVSNFRNAVFSSMPAIFPNPKCLSMGKGRLLELRKADRVGFDTLAEAVKGMLATDNWVDVADGGEHTFVAAPPPPATTETADATTATAPTQTQGWGAWAASWVGIGGSTTPAETEGTANPADGATDATTEDDAA